MKRSTTVLCGVLLVCVCVWAGSRLWEVRAQAAADEARVKREAAVLAAQALATAQDAARNALERAFEDHAMARFLPATYQRPASDWQSNEKDFYGKMLSAEKFDVLVVPFQVLGWGVDRATRSIMTAELAASLAQLQKVKIPDPYLVAKALGEGQRQLKQEDIYRLADAVRAKRIVRGYVGHDQKGKMAVTIFTQDHAGTARDGTAWASPAITRKFGDISFGDEVPAIQAYESVLPEILKFVGADPPAPLFEQRESKLALDVLPPSPLRLISTTGNPAQDAYGFLLYSALTPANIERTKEIFAEKAHLALLGLSPASPEYRALRARTYMALGLRVAALKVLGEPQTSEEKELLAALNGNLLEVRELAADEKNPLKRVLQKLDEIRIGTSYGVMTSKKATAEANALKLPGAIWPFIVTRAFVEWDVWSQYDNASLKALLDYELPVKGYSLEVMARDVLPLADPEKVQAIVDLSVFNHGRKFIETNAAKRCCELTFNRPDPFDYLELLQATGHDNLMRRIYFLSRVQGVANKAISFADAIGGTYRGYPYYELERSSAQAYLAEKFAGAEKEALRKAAADNAFNAMYWEQGQSLIAARALVQSNPNSAKLLDNLYNTDVPYRPYYPTWSREGRHVDNKHAALGNATREIETVVQLAGQYQQSVSDEKRVGELLKSISGRFAGSPQLNALLGAEAMRIGDTKSAEAYFRDNIRLSPTYWSSYEALAGMLFKAGDVNAAAKVFHSYPGFRPGSEEGRVSIANLAFRAGSYFYWTGHFDLARSFYQISASQRPGASSDLTSDARLKLLAGNLQGAMLGTLQRAQRYQESHAHRDYLAMLHASGHSRDAWAGFGLLLKQGKEPHIWESALTGHHMAGLSEAEVVSWAQESAKKDRQIKDEVMVYLTRFATTDRTPSGGLAEVIEGLDTPRWKTAGRPELSYGGNPAAAYGSIMKWPGEPEKRRVKSDHTYFVQAYRALKLKDFAGANAIFAEASDVYDLTDQQEHHFYSAFLPYYAYAAAKAGDTSGIEKILSSVKLADQRFDYLLARAVLAGAAGKKEEAVQSLELARYRRPHTDQRALLTQSTYGEIAEIVADLTASPKAREVALDWARKSQKFEPWQSWSYALEARVSRNPVERKRAMAMLFYLDPKSETLTAFDRPEVEAAVKAYGKSNPFLDIKPEVVKKEAI
jgi:hypothetical protein